MTKIRSILIIFFVISLLSGCGASVDTVSNPDGTPLDMAAEIIQSQMDVPSLEILLSNESEFTAYLTQIYGISEEELMDGVVCYAGGIEASEIAILTFSDEDAAKSAESALLDYIKGRADSFAGYVPDQADLVENSTAVQQGHYVALLICVDPAAAQEAFLSCFEAGWEPSLEVADIPALSQMKIKDTLDDFLKSAEPNTKGESSMPPTVEPDAKNELSMLAAEKESSDQTEDINESKTENLVKAETEDVSVPPDSESIEFSPPAVLNETASTGTAGESVGDYYDHSAVVLAWRNRDISNLSDKNRAVYNAAANVISQVVTDGMTPYQQELAIHDYLTAYCQYDPDANSNALSATPDPDNENPYGMLVNGVGICRGYSSTFQLFMDLLNIECITISGRSGENEHAWNMVRLNGEWYCVDVTWDDPSGGIPTHHYFNVTSQFLRNNRHQWEPSGVPETEAVRWAYQD